MTATERENSPTAPHTRMLRALVLDTIRTTARIQPAEWGENAYFDPKQIRRYTEIANELLDGEWEAKCAERLRPILRDYDRSSLLVLLTLARIGRGALLTTIPVLHAALAAAFPTRDALLAELTSTHATTLAPDVLAGYRRARLGGEDVGLAATLRARVAHGTRVAVSARIAEAL